MKKFITAIFVLFLSVNYTSAYEIQGLKGNSIKSNSVLSYDNDSMLWQTGKKTDTYFKKTNEEFSEYLYPSGDFAFTTDCELEFLSNGRFIGYSNKDLNFYMFYFKDGVLEKEILSKEKIQALLPDYRIIPLSAFSKYTNSVKIKKRMGDLKILLLNDINKDFSEYEFSSGNAKFKTNKAAGIIYVTKPGMIQFSKKEENTPENPWFIILVR